MNQPPSPNPFDCTPQIIITKPNDDYFNKEASKASEASPSYWEELSLFLKTFERESKDNKAAGPTNNIHLLKDYIKFKALRDLSNSATTTLPQSDLENLTHLALCSEELLIDTEMENADSMSICSKPLSIPDDSSIMPSRRESFISNFSYDRRQSVLSNISNRNISLSSNKRVSFLASADPDSLDDLSRGQLDLSSLHLPSLHSTSLTHNMKKRNSAIIATLPAKQVNLNHRKSMREMIRRGSKQSIDLSPFKLGFALKLDRPIGQFKEAHSDDETSVSSSDSSDDESKYDDLGEVATQNFFKLKILNHDTVKFTESDGSAHSKELNRMNLLSYNTEDEIESPFKMLGYHRLHPSENKFKKFRVDSKGPNLAKMPFYLLSQENFVRSIYRQKGTEMILQQKISESPAAIYSLGQFSPPPPNDSSKYSAGEEEMILSLGTFKFKDQNRDIRSSLYHFYVGRKLTSSKDLSQDSSLELFDNYTITVENNTLYSHVFNAKCLKDASLQEHCQVKVDFAKSRFPVNMYALVFLQYGRGHDSLPILPSSILQLIASFLREDKLYVKDSGSRRGTFVKLAHRNPVRLTEGMLMMLNNRVGFYIKRLNSTSEENVRLNRECDLHCLNQEDIQEEALPLGQIGQRADITKLIRKMQRNELRGLIEQAGCPYVIIEIVMWNSKLNFYEERGAVCLLFNDQDTSLAEPGANSVPLLSYSSKSWCYFSEVEAVQQVLKLFKNPSEILLSYNLEEEAWIIETSPEKVRTREEATCEGYDELNGYEFDFESVFLGSNKTSNNSRTARINGVSGMVSGSDCEKEGLWLSTSPFNILQDRFEPRWVEVAKGSALRFGSSVLQMDFEQLKSTIQRTKDIRTESLCKSPPKKISDLINVFESN